MTSHPGSVVARRHDRRAGTALGLLCLAQFVVILDTTVVNVALPSIGTDLGFTSGSGLQYVISLYALTFGGTLVLAGRAADLFGRRRVFAAGVIGFAGSSLACALSATPYALLAARAVQGLASALVSASALALVTTLFASGEERARALGVWGAVSGAAGASGLVLGGTLTDTLGWESVFVVNVPIGAAAAVAAPLLLPRDAVGVGRPSGATNRGVRVLDLPGAVAVTAGIGLLILACTRVQDDAVGAVPLFVAAGVGLGVFVVVERRARQPLVRFRLFLLPGVAAANVVALLLTTVVASNLFFTTLYVQRMLGLTPLLTGLAFLPNSALVMVGSAVGSRLVRLVGTRAVLVGGLAVLAGAALLLAGVDEHGSYLHDVLPGFALTGLGLGLTFVAVTVGATRGVGERDQGLASGVVNTAQQLGFAVGIAAVVGAAGADGYRTGYLVDAGIAGLAIAVALVLDRSGRPGR